MKATSLFKQSRLGRFVSHFVSHLLLAGALAFALASRAGDCCADGPRRSCCATPEPTPGQLSDKSLYQLDASWTNDRGERAQLASLKGHPQIVTMFFAHCQYACPLLVYKMKQIEAALTEDLRTNISFTLVSFDSERDTPEVLRGYRAQNGLGSRWTLLHGTPDNVLELAALLGVKFKQDAQGQFLHSNVITLMSPEGEIAYQESGLNLDATEMVRQVQNLVRGSGVNLSASNSAGKP
jgi:protein SCO1/2